MFRFKNKSISGIPRFQHIWFTIKQKKQIFRNISPLDSHSFIRESIGCFLYSITFSRNLLDFSSTSQNHLQHILLKKAHIKDGLRIPAESVYSANFNNFFSFLGRSKHKAHEPKNCNYYLFYFQRSFTSGNSPIPWRNRTSPVAFVFVTSIQSLYMRSASIGVIESSFTSEV